MEKPIPILIKGAFVAPAMHNEDYSVKVFSSGADLPTLLKNARLCVVCPLGKHGHGWPIIVGGGDYEQEALNAVRSHYEAAAGAITDREFQNAVAVAFREPAPNYMTWGDYERGDQ